MNLGNEIAKCIKVMRSKGTFPYGQREVFKAIKNHHPLNDIHKALLQVDHYKPEYPNSYFHAILRREIHIIKRREAPELLKSILARAV